MNGEFLKSLISSPLTRRDFAKKLGLTGAGVAGATMLGSTVLGGALQSAHAQTTTTSTFTDTDILNFALNLEYLEAEFYTYASNNDSIADQGVIPSSAVGGPTTGGHMVPNFGASPIAYLASALKLDEQQHVKLLRSALGSSAVKKPAINLNALGLGFGSVNEFLTLARAFEDVGLSAYLGAAGLIQSKTYLQTAAAILSTESQHSGSIRSQVLLRSLTVPPVDSVDVVPTQQHPFNVDQNALAIPRTPQQVLKIVYAGGNTSGGFFPEGLNGNINSAA